jgi:arylsulfatase A-like enzyme
MKSKLPNIVLIIMDTVGAKHMSLYGYHRKTTPNLERLANYCTVYTRCFAPACWTLPSHGSMFTGLYPSQHGAYEGRFLLDDNSQHIATALKMSGYRTFGISSNGLVSPAAGMCPDFDYFKDFGGTFLDLFMRGYNPVDPPEKSEELDKLSGLLFEGLTKRERLEKLIKYTLETGEWKAALASLARSLRNRLDGLFFPNPMDNSARFTEKTVKIFPGLLEEGNAQPVFIFINFFEAHEFYRPPRRWRQFSRWNDRQLWPIGHSNSKSDKSLLAHFTEINNNLYDDELYYLDHKIGQMWDILRNSPAADSTVFILTSDHGEHFGEKNHYGHALSLYNELLWVPMLIHFPQGMADQGPVGKLVSLNDVYATLLDLANSPLPRPETSSSLLQSTGREIALAQYIYPEQNKMELEGLRKQYELNGLRFSPPIFAVITDAGKKIIQRRDQSLEIYDLRTDMDEKHNLAPAMPSEALENIAGMVEVFKVDTAYNDAVKQISEKKILN